MMFFGKVCLDPRTAGLVGTDFGICHQRARGPELPGKGMCRLQPTCIGKSGNLP